MGHGLAAPPEGLRKQPCKNYVFVQIRFLLALECTVLLRCLSLSL